MYVPLSVIANMAKPNNKGANLRLKQKTRQKVIFKDIVVDRKRSPELYNIRKALQVYENVANGPQQSPVKRGINEYSVGEGRTFQGRMAGTLMTKLGFSVVPIPEDHSLLYCQDDRPEEENSNIFDKMEFVRARNQLGPIVDKFPDENDPIYELDQGRFDLNYYEIQKEVNKDPYKNPDNPNENSYDNREGQPIGAPNMSNLAASVAQVNLSYIYNGASKYFVEPNSPDQKGQGMGHIKSNKKPKYKKSQSVVTVSPYDVADPNKEDRIAQLITLDQKNGSLQNIGIYTNKETTIFVQRSDDTAALLRNAEGSNSLTQYVTVSTRTATLPTRNQQASRGTVLRRTEPRSLGSTNTRNRQRDIGATLATQTAPVGEGY